MFDFVTIGEALNYVSAGKGILIDVRHEQDFRKGHLRGADNIPLEKISDGSFGIHPKLNSATCKLILYCQTGTGSLIAARKLDREGYDACSISGGIGDYKGQLDRG